MNGSKERNDARGELGGSEGRKYLEEIFKGSHLHGLCEGPSSTEKLLLAPGGREGTLSGGTS